MTARFFGLDILRGVLLVLMAVSHLPTRFRAYSHDFFGLISAAEGFIFMAAFLAAFLYTPKAQARGWAHVSGKLTARARELYGYHLMLLGLAFALVFIFAERTALERLLWFYLEQPVQATFGAALLLYCPSLFDILPLYVIFLALSPFILKRASVRGFSGMFVVSVALWGIAQLGVRQHLLGLSTQFHGIPAEAFGAFDLLAWQLLWMIGLWAGVKTASLSSVTNLMPPRWLWLSALSFCLLCLYLRYGNLPFDLEHEAPFAVDKWRLAPLRIANLLGLSVLAVRFGPRLARLPFLRGFAYLGRSSLQVFCTHLVLCLLCCVLFDDMVEELTLLEELLILSVTLASMVGAAFVRSEGLSSLKARAA